MAADDRITYIDNDSVGLWYHPKENAVHHHLKAFVFGEDFRSLMLKGAEIFIEKGAKKWLSDDRGNSAIRTEDIQWGEEVWVPKVLQAGWKYWAIVMPEKVLGQMNMRRIIKQYKDRELTIQIFSDPDEGLAWLAEQS